MPPLPSVAAVKAEMINGVTGVGRNWVNIFHFSYSPNTPPTQSQLNAMAAAWDTDYESIQNFCHTSDKHIESIYTDLSSASGVRTVTTPGVAGGSTGAIAPLHSCAVISWQIARRYRGGHPRTYLSALTDAQLVGPISMDTTFQLNLANQAATVLGNWLARTISGVTWTLGAVSYRTGNAPRATPVFEPFTAVTVHSRIDTQRRRLGKES